MGMHNDVENQNKNFMFNSRLLYFIFIPALLLCNCKTTKNEQLIPEKTIINWSVNQSTSYMKTTKELKSNKIPDSVFSMTQLTYLGITGMNCDHNVEPSCWTINEIPPQIKALKNLRSLVLNFNNVTKIPKEIKYLQHLTILDLNDNAGLTDISPITYLRNLQNLFLNNCNLSKLPGSMRKLQNLKVLGIKGNHLSAQEIRKIKNLLPFTEISD
jgi:Leucine-rich repeat (LRR) protein